MHAWDVAKAASAGLRLTCSIHSWAVDKHVDSTLIELRR